METIDSKIAALEQKLKGLGDTDPFMGDEDFFRDLPEKLQDKLKRKNSPQRINLFYLAALGAAATAVVLLVLNLLRQPDLPDPLPTAEITVDREVEPDITWIEESIICEMIMESLTPQDFALEMETHLPGNSAAQSYDKLVEDITLEEIIQYLSNKDL